MKNKIKVIMIGSSLDVKGGMTTVVEGFINNNFQPEVGLKYIPTHKNGNNIVKTTYFLGQFLKILAILIFLKVDIIHMHMSERGSFERKYLIFKVAKLFRKKVILHTHGAEFEEFFIESTLKKQRKIKKLLKEVDLVITLGEKWNGIYKELEPTSNTVVLRNAVDIPESSNEINDKNINLLFLAVLIKRKGILDLIEVSKDIIVELEKSGKNIVFTIAGDGELLDSAKNLVKEQQIERHYNFVGWVNKTEKIKLLKQTDVMVLPSYNEGLPLSILEAMSYGIPIISTEVGSIDEAVVDGVNGFLIKPGNKIELKQKIINLVTTDELYNMGIKSRGFAEEKFNNTIYFKQILKIYKDLNS